MVRNVFISGVFNVLHPGHFRILEYAKSQGDRLIVGILSDILCVGECVNEKIRLKNLKSVSYVDEVFILKTNASDYIRDNKPEIVVKGNEHKNIVNSDIEIIKSYNGQLIFSSGQIKETIYKDNPSLNSNLNNFEFPFEYMERHSIKIEIIKKIISGFSSVNLSVFGDLIIDTYINCQGIGMSREEPTIVMRPIESSKYVGGAGIVAKHASNLKAGVSLYSISGEDEENKFLIDDLSKNNVDHFVVEDLKRPTTQKFRYVANNKTLFRVNDYSEATLSKKAENLIFSEFKKNITKYDLVILSDFSYGALSQNLINKIIKISRNNNLIIVSDSQSSSQIGDITKFKKSSIITPTEHEARLALKNYHDGIYELARKLKEVCQVDTVVLTLGADGIIIVTDDKDINDVKIDVIPSLQKNPKDVAGAGDAFLLGMSLSIAKNANIWEACFIGSLLAGIQVSRQGNIPVSINELNEVLSI